MGAGFGFVGLGVLGAILPVLPSTVFFILALWAFKKSSPRLERKLLEHPVVGPTLRDWERNGSVKPRTKRVAIAMLWVCLIVSAVFVWQKPVVLGILAGVGISVSVYIWTRPNASPAQAPS